MPPEEAGRRIGRRRSATTTKELNARIRPRQAHRPGEPAGSLPAAPLHALDRRPGRGPDVRGSRPQQWIPSRRRCATLVGLEDGIVDPVPLHPADHRHLSVVSAHPGRQAGPVNRARHGLKRPPRIRGPLNVSPLRPPPGVAGCLATLVRRLGKPQPGTHRLPVPAAGPCRERIELSGWLHGAAATTRPSCSPGR